MSKTESPEYTKVRPDLQVYCARSSCQFSPPDSLAPVLPPQKIEDQQAGQYDAEEGPLKLSALQAEQSSLLEIKEYSLRVQPKLCFGEYASSLH